ncbi:cupin domain-containing protein [Algoriphagus aquimarinus]|uniref:cupin domain-containing protein n=1 Tax=Algoriphagus aquimarinus TaxID=237018 RepID=UPI0030DAE0A2
MEGEYLFQVGDDKYQIKSGDTIFLPRNVQHAFIQLTEKGKMEAFFKVTDKWTSPPTKEEIVKVFADHDMKVVGTPLKADD